MSVAKIRSRPSSPASRAELDVDDSPCTHHPDCEGEHVLAPGCHPGAPVRALYGHGVLKLICAVCEHGVAAILVAAHRDN